MTSRAPQTHSPADMSTTKPSPPPRPKNWLLMKFREWHIQAGVVVALFLLSVGATGIYLNHKKQFNGWLGLEAKPAGPMAKPEKPAPSDSGPALTAATLATLPVTFPRALELVRARWGEEPLERLELKAEHGELLYKAKALHGGELWIDAHTAAIVVKPRFTKLGPKDRDGKRAESFDWGKFALDLHTGKIFGEAGKLLMSAVSFVMLTLTLSGLYLWAVPKWRKWRAKQPVAAHVPASAVARAPVAEAKSPAVA